MLSILGIFTQSDLKLFSVTWVCFLPQGRITDVHRFINRYLFRTYRLFILLLRTILNKTGHHPCPHGLYNTVRF